jgi:ribosomal-protein-alanine N-acetyltransferase
VGETATIRIGIMKTDDLDQVFAIERASFSSPWSWQLFLRELHNPAISTLLVAFEDLETSRGGQPPARAVKGYVVFWVVADEMHILNLAVAPTYRQQGIAKRLVQGALEKAYGKGARTAYLEVRASNAAAQKLYLGLGFTGISLRRGYYDRPTEDAVIMELGPGAFKTLVEQKN